MKLILKIVFAPVIALLWLLCGFCNLCLRVSSVLLGLIAALLAAAGIITVLAGNTLTGCIGLGVAVLLSPYGIPLLAALVLARFYGFRYWLSDKIYG